MNKKKPKPANKSQQPLRARENRGPGRPSAAAAKIAQDQFLANYAQTGTIQAASRLTGINRSSHHDWMKNPHYQARFLAAHEEFLETLEGTAYRRALAGVEKTLFYKDKPLQLPDPIPGDPGHMKNYTEREYSDNLLINALRANLPGKYREKYEHEIAGPQGGPIKIEIVYHETTVKDN